MSNGKREEPTPPTVVWIDETGRPRPYARPRRADVTLASLLADEDQQYTGGIVERLIMTLYRKRVLTDAEFVAILGDDLKIVDDEEHASGG